MHDLHTVFSAEVIEGTTLTRRTLGRIRTAGAIAAYDPLTTDEALPFVTRVPPGCWPVEVLLGQTRGDTRVQLARIVFEDTVPVRFELALVEGQDVRTLGPGETFGYGVDTGVGCFAGPGLQGVDAEWVLRALREHEEASWTYAVSDALVAFSSGYGDGVYSSYVGYDAEGRVVSLTTDFSIFALALPTLTPDMAYREARAAELFDAMMKGLARLGGPAHGQAWTEAMELATLRDAAAHLVPRFVDAITQRAPDCDPDDPSSLPSLAVDLLIATLGKILGRAEADHRFAAESARLDEDTLVRVLSKRHRPSTREDPRGREALVEAVLARVDEASPALLGHALRLLDSEGAALHPALPTLATRALRVAIADPSELMADALVRAALEPFTRERWNGEEALVHEAPEALVALAEESLAIFEEDDVQQCLAGMLIEQGRGDRVALHAERTGRLGPLLRLASDPVHGAMARACLHAIACDPGRSHDTRFQAITRLEAPKEQCVLLRSLGLDGFESAAIQLGYLDATAHAEVLEALDELAKRAPTKSLRRSAVDTARRIRRHAAVA